jgi:outer membrane protein OmpA-like peptidoglycan-associated protein
MRAQTSKSVFGILSVAGLLAARAPVWSQGATAHVDPPVIEHIEDTTDIKVVAPTNTMQGTRGLSQTSSAEALGEGRLVFGLHGPWYRQQKEFQGVPNAKADIFTGVGTVAYGISRQWDVFASITGYGTQNYNGANASGLGTIGGGIQATLPFTPSAPLRMGAQAGVYNGLSKNPIDSNFADGYNYFETRTGMDFRGSLIQTLVFGSEDAAIKLHLNEGVVTSIESGVDPLMLLATGLQFNLPVAALGIELHSRTALNDINFMKDPLWVTPSLQFRTAYNLNLSLGTDFSLSQERTSAPSGAVRSLEPYRVFGGLAFTFDTQAEKRRQEKLERIRAAQERQRLRIKNEELAYRSRQDSIEAASAAEAADAIAARAREDSMAQARISAERARHDSLSLADARRNLEIEKSKRSDMENQLLNTGMLVMDAVYFETGKTDISINSKPYLNMLAKMLVKYPKLQIEVAGHTDNVGSDAYNQNLSQGRAMAVMTYLVSQAPELSTRLTARGYGESMAKADNTTAEGRKYNRRTELQVLNKTALREYNEPTRTSGTGAVPSDHAAGTGADSSAPRDSSYTK